MGQRLALDVDGTVASFQSGFITECGGDPDDWKKWEGWDFSHCPVEMPVEGRLKVWERVQKDTRFWRRLEPAYGASLTRLSQVSRHHEVYFITHRPPATFAATAEWLERYEIQPSALIYCDPNDKESKRKLCSQLRIEAFIDDHGDLVGAFEGYKPKAFLISRPWNKHIEAGVERVNSVGEFLDRVLVKP